ncbi:hypothetical protein K1T71_011241 [Dendrolimus kikuchii]|uniref:Uncharacterized protein n=1 Tax=Dendrolimus kikuchii TaxID=765133 RepID=A0ACC1CNI3_9NEOP|nr:hypothetical protein K1T71_011241 [Dendrolimus kikuchii]
MEPSKEAIAVRITRLNRQILGKVTSGSNKLNKRTIDREALLDALTVLYDECNDDPVKRTDDLVRAFVDKYRSTLAELRRTRVCFSDFQVLQTIGRGYFGEVHMVREKQTSDVYALKTLRKDQACKRSAGAAEDERDVLATANGPWFPRLQYAFQDSSNLYLVMELCNGGDLAGLLARRNNPLSERDAAFYVAEVAHALKALHGMGYVHRDVKPQNILLDRCGHVKLGDFGSCARLTEGGCARAPVGTAEYAAPEVLAAAECASRHTVCLEYCRGIVAHAISACDYWSLGVVAFELVTLRRPFSTSDDDSMAQILSNIQKYERDPNAEPPFEALPNGPSPAWRALVAGLLRVQPAKRYNYLDTLQHAALAHIAVHSIRDQASKASDTNPFVDPAWHMIRRSPFPIGTELVEAAVSSVQFLDTVYIVSLVGYSYVTPDDPEDNSGGFNASHDCTAIDLATFKSAEKLATMRSKEITSLQSKLAAAEAAVSAAVDRARREADAETERLRARLQADITALSLQNRRLERQIEVEKEERMALHRTNQELSTSLAERSNAETRSARAEAAQLQAEKEVLKSDIRRLETKVEELQAECARTSASADAQRAQHQHYKDILEHVNGLRHRRLTEINVRAIDTVAKERAIRRQTLSGGEAENREAGARAAAAEANAAREVRAREQIEKRVNTLEGENRNLQMELDQARRELASTQESLGEKQRSSYAFSEQLNEVQIQLAQEKLRVTTLLAQVQELEHGLEESVRRETALEEQCARTEVRLHERLEAAEARAAGALQDDARHREKVNTLEQLVRQLEREVSALETRGCLRCAARADADDKDAQSSPVNKRDAHSDTESVGDAAHAQVALLKEQLERAEAQLQARAEEIATLKQETRAANLARWRKEREFNELTIETKSNARDIKRLEERLQSATEARKSAEKRSSELQSEMATLKPQYERASKDLERVKEQLQKLQKSHETAQTEVDRSRNDIRKLKSELQYSERRRLHAEEQEELSSRERAQLRDELTELRHAHNNVIENNKALQEACSLLEDQLTDLERLADLHEFKSKDLETETQRLRIELESCRSRLAVADRSAAQNASATALASAGHEEAREEAKHLHCQLQLLRERLESREARVAELESRVAALTSTARRIRDLQEECASLRTRAHEHHTHALHLQATLADVQEELSAAREAAEAASAWWRTRETKADATLRQQAKLIDFLQAKVEEAGRKKCSLSNKLFGRSGRRPNASPPLRRANRELREEVDRLRANYLQTPKRERSKPSPKQVKSLDTQDSRQEDSLQLVWSDGIRERLSARYEDGVMLVKKGDKELSARLVATDAKNLPQNEANRAFTIKFEGINQEAAVVCSSISERSQWVSKLQVAAAPPPGYRGALLATLRSEPEAALYVAPGAIAIGCADGLRSLRGEIRLEWDSELSPPRRADSHAVRHLAAANGRALLAISGDSVEGPCVAVASGRRVFLLRFDAAASDFKVSRSLHVDRPPYSLLLTQKALYIAGEKPLKVNLPSGALETFAMDDTVVSAAARKHSAPKSILLIHNNPVEILLCYSECGVFVDGNGKRTRIEDPKWSTAVHGWEFVKPFLYVIGEEKVTIIYLSEETYKAPPCTCDTTSLASSASECYAPEIFHLRVKESVLLGTTPNGIIIRSRADDGYNITVVEGMAAFRSIGASIESLETISDNKSSSTDLRQSLTDVSVHEVSQESIEASTGFLADIRKRARQLRNKQRKEQSPDDIIKEILKTEVSIKRNLNGRKSPPTASEFDSDSTEDSDEKTESTKGTSDLCAEMFTRQVRFQQ